MDFLIEITISDITHQQTEAIVNAANNSLLGGGGVDGAIHRAAGPKLLEECRLLSGCKTGEAKITKGYNLPSKWVIHTVGPVWYGGKYNEPQLLAGCYYNSLKLAAEYKINSISFPAISTGVYRFPHEMATEIALSTTKDFLEKQPGFPRKVVFVCFSRNDFETSCRIADSLGIKFTSNH